MTLINVNSGTDYTEDAVALDNFSAIQLYTGAGVDTPNLQRQQLPRSADQRRRGEQHGVHVAWAAGNG